ncbi:uncharacterized protein LOC105428048 isoform X3 [Pogonomyrmex barbatus]|uniref:Uncharacterized protein LOC105428048 isoform X3 n=1 Tax=Pogonomyrmex barbatus TaxID=144034 RepID=A0A6I9W8E5_9HYME|nr:uncharacterized protein LOC105428048 isoform X3 [Pogonomyrmex barbatus]
MLILGKNGVTVPVDDGPPTPAGRTRDGCTLTTAARRCARISGADGRGPAGFAPCRQLAGPGSPAEISVHAGVNEPISGGKRSLWTNGITNAGRV